MTDDEREHECSALASEMIEFMHNKLAATKGTGYRGTQDLELAIYGWLWEHAIFEDERP